MDALTDLCTLRPWRDGDQHDLVRHANNRQVWLGLRDRFPHPYTLADAEAFLARVQAQNPLTVFAIAVEDRPVGGIGLMLGIAFKGQNVAYMVGLAFAIAASANFPALVLSVFWRAFTTRAAQVSMLTGTATSLALIYLSPTIQIDILKHESAAFPLRNPGLISIPLSFAVAIAVSLLWPEPAAAKGFAEVERRVHVGADPAVDRVR